MLHPPPSCGDRMGNSPSQGIPQGRALLPRETQETRVLPPPPRGAGVLPQVKARSTRPGVSHRAGKRGWEIEFPLQDTKYGNNGKTAPLGFVIRTLARRCNRGWYSRPGESVPFCGSRRGSAGRSLFTADQAAPLLRLIRPLVPSSVAI